MMPKSDYWPPDGSGEIKLPDIAMLKWLVMNKDAEYWQSGCGQGEIRRYDDVVRESLILTMDPTLGFCIEYDDQLESYVSIGEGNFEETVTVYIGGEAIPLPTAFFVSRESACLAVEEFCGTGRKTEKIRWKTRREANWHYGYPEDAEIEE